MGRGNFEGEVASHCKVYGQSAVICAKTAKPVEMPFGLWFRMDRRNHVLDGGPEVLRNVAMATIFWLSVYGVHIGATWRLRLKRPCAAAM